VTLLRLDRVVLVVLDGVGAGALPDAANFGPPDADSRANCLANVARAVGGLALPHLSALGLGNITTIAGTPPAAIPAGCFGRMAERSAAKDSATGHWEIAGVITATPPPTYPQGFPPAIVAPFEAAIGRKILGNVAASGTAIIAALGEEHLRTGSPIIYTSADSVFQIAAHEAIVPVEELYRWCAIARALLVPPHAVGRVIARPFAGTPGHFTRTPRRRDFALPPPGRTLLDALSAARYDVIGLGKIGDLFCERGLTHSEHPPDDAATMTATIQWLDRSWHGLLFVNLIDCDQRWGHRRDPVGYASALRAVDFWIPDVLGRLGPDDALFVTADHGTDPTVAGTDHTREFVPLLGWGQQIRAGVDLGTRASFADLGATVAQAVGLPESLAAGESFWESIALAEPSHRIRKGRREQHMANAEEIARVFGAYDIRGIVPDALNAGIAYQVARGLVISVGASEVLVGRDMRLSSPEIAQAVLRGIADQGANAVDLGLTTTDELYFAVGQYGAPAGIMITASHNPGNYNGLKLCREQAIPLSDKSGLEAIRDMIIAGSLPEPAQKGSITQRDALSDFVGHVLSFIDPAAIHPLTIAADAGNGMAGMVLPRVFAQLPQCTLLPLYFELDGHFPHHPASPIEAENMADLGALVREQHANIGVAFDGDADRMFITDEHGNQIDGSITTALVATSILRKNPGATVLYNLICSRSVPEAIERAGGRAMRTRVGHSFIKPQMRAENAIFGGEHSGHFYFRDNFYADSGLIAFLHVLELMSQEQKPVSELIAPFNTRFRSGEINTRLPSHAAMQAKIEEIAHIYGVKGARIDRLDGVTVEFPDWWFNVRGSNTEPLLRLNVEGDTRALMERGRNETQALIRGE
jgi:phosphomannomutase